MNPFLHIDKDEYIVYSDRTTPIKNKDKSLEDWKSRLKQETLDLVEKVNKLQDFLKTQTFYKLPRVEKDLIYAQYKAMIDYLQVLGQRCEIYGIVLFGE